ncbi:MAG: PLP-dependent transferase [Proteobacteria bacterium]|nr:PLP-dependent transferase [Pseudomonadota bacterium]
MTDHHPDKPATLLASAAHFRDAATGGIVPPLYASTTYARDANYELPHDRLYGRDDNPLFEQAENILCQLEGGADAALFASGLAAMTAVAATLQPGERVVLSKQCYFGVRHWLGSEAARVGFELVLFDAGDPGALEKVLGNDPARLVWCESPANPTWEVTDLEAAATLAHAAGARIIVDATVMTPLLCNPIALGVDYVMHSATKYLNGHADVVAGALIAARDDADWQAIRGMRYRTGGILGPFEAWLLIRGMRTLDVRLRRSCANAMAIARHFEGNPNIREVMYPGLESHAGYEIATRQWNTGIGYTGMLSLRIAAGSDEESAAVAKRMATRTRLFAPATSLGGVESLIEHRKTIEGAGGEVPGDLLRLSAGIEDADDLIADLDQALAGALAAG